MRWFLFLFVLATPLAAETPMSAEEFDEYVTGRTLTYGAAGEAYGVERYHSGRRVTWAFVGEDCEEGSWAPDESGAICFYYEGLPEEQCWRFFREAGGLRAEFVDGDGSATLYEVEDEALDLICPGYGA